MGLKSFTFEVKKPWPLVLGIDLGSSSLKYILLRRKARTIRVESFGRYSLQNGEVDTSEKMQQVVSELFSKDSIFKKAKTVVGLHAQNMLVKRESFPPLSKDELKQTISFEVQKELGKEDEGAHVVYDFFQIGEDPEKSGNTEYLSVGMPEEVVTDRIRHIVAQDVIPTKVTPSVVALSNLISHIEPLHAADVTGILDIGSSSSTLVFFRNGQVDFFREISVGGEDFTRAITGTIFHEGRAIQFTADEAREFKAKYGYPLGFSEGMTYKGAPLAEVGALMRPVLERLASEIQRSIGFYSDKTEGSLIEALFLTGGGAQLKHLSEVLTSKIELPVTQLETPNHLSVAGKQEDDEAFHNKYLEQATALSLALESSNNGNLLPKAYKKILQKNIIQRSLQFAAVLFLAMVTFFSFQTYGKLRHLKNRVGQTERRVAISQDTGPRYAALVAQKNALEVKIQSIKAQAGQDETLVQVLRLISHVIPSNLSLTFAEYGPERNVAAQMKDETDAGAKKWVVRLRGMTPRPSNDVAIYLAQFIVELEKSGYFANVALVKDILSPDDEEYWFEIVGTLKQDGEA